MGRRAVLEGVHQEAELFARAFLRESEQLEHGVLQLGVVDTNGAAAQFGAVHHDVVGCGAHLAGVAVQQGNVFGVRRGEGVVHGVVALCLVVPLEEREVDYPKRGEDILVAQAEAFAHFEAQFAELLARLVGRPRE